MTTKLNRENVNHKLALRLQQEFNNEEYARKLQLQQNGNNAIKLQKEFNNENKQIRSNHKLAQHLQKEFNNENKQIRSNHKLAQRTKQEVAERKKQAVVKCKKSENIKCKKSENIKCKKSENIKCKKSENIKCKKLKNQCSVTKLRYIPGIIRNRLSRYKIIPFINQHNVNCYYRASLHILYHIYNQSALFRTSCQSQDILCNILQYINSKHLSNTVIINGNDSELLYPRVERLVFNEVGRQQDANQLINYLLDENLYKSVTKNFISSTSHILNIVNSLNYNLILSRFLLFEIEFDISNINNKKSIQIEEKIIVQNKQYKCIGFIVRGRDRLNARNANRGSNTRLINNVGDRYGQCGHYFAYIYQNNKWYNYNYISSHQDDLNKQTKIIVPIDLKPVTILYKQV
jgi:hypothetical protein